MGKNKKDLILSDSVLSVLGKPNTKIFILDTSVMIHDSRAINSFGDNFVIIPIWNIEELDKLKNCPNGKGASARKVSRILDDYRKQGSLSSSLSKGVFTNNGGVLFVDYSGRDFTDLPVGLERNNDNRSIIIARKWQKLYPKKQIILVSKDINLRLKADCFGIIAQDFEGDKKISSIDELYSGFLNIEVNDQEVIQNLYRFGAEIIEDSQFIEKKPVLLENICCRISFKNKCALAIYKKGEFKVVRRQRKEKAEKLIQPANDEQTLAFSLLMDKAIHLVTLGGAAGTGKTLIALLSAVEQLGKVYDEIIVYRPNWEIGQPLGALPGDKEEKFAPWKRPIIDKLKEILKGRNIQQNESSEVEKLIDSRIYIEPINYIRGRSIKRTFILVDEAQNIRPEEAKTITTRAGVGTKVVLVGDVTQIDNPYVDAISNGLTAVIEGFKGHPIFGHISLQESLRSDLAELAAKFL